MSSDESDGVATKCPTKRPPNCPKTILDAQWRKWQKTTLQIYKLAQRRLNVRQTLPFGEFVNEICQTVGIRYVHGDAKYFMHKWQLLSEEDRKSYYRQKG